MCVFILWAEAKFHHHKYGRLTLPALLGLLTGIFYVFLAFNYAIDSNPEISTWSTYYC